MVKSRFLREGRISHRNNSGVDRTSLRKPRISILARVCRLITHIPARYASRNGDVPAESGNGTRHGPRTAAATDDKDSSRSSNYSSAGSRAEWSSPAVPPSSPILPPSSPSSEEGAVAFEEEQEEGELVRLQELLQARGRSSIDLPVGNMPQIRGSRTQQLVADLQAADDERRQLRAAAELGQLLVMGSDDELADFPVNKVILPLTHLILADSSTELMMQGCRTLTYLLETLPQSSAGAVAALPALLQRLQNIRFVDIAEQALTALELISKRHSNCVLQAGGIAACLAYMDFFSIPAQRSALCVTANCCLSLTSAEFHRVKDLLPVLAKRLILSDRETVEAACLCFCRLADTFRADAVRLAVLADSGLLTHVQQLLLASPTVIGSTSFCELLRMLRILVSQCAPIRAQLLDDDMSSTLLTLLQAEPEQGSCVVRSSEEVSAMVSLVVELLPPLPPSAPFDVDPWPSRQPAKQTVSASTTSTQQQETSTWQWRDDSGHWQSFSEADCAAIQAARRSGLTHITVERLCGRLDLHRLELVTTSEKARAVRFHSPLPHPTLPPRAWLPLLLRLYADVGRLGTRHTCLQAMLRLLRCVADEELKDCVPVQAMSVHLAGILNSADIRAVVAGLQMTEIMLIKTPDACQTSFRREGVLHQLSILAGDSGGQGDHRPTPSSRHSIAISEQASADLSLREVLKRRRSSRRSSLAAHRRSREASSLDATAHGYQLLDNDTSNGTRTRLSSAGRSKSLGGTGGGGSTGGNTSGSSRFQASLLANLSPARWNRASSSSPAGRRSPTKIGRAGSSGCAHTDRLQSWVCQQSQQLLQQLQGAGASCDQSEAAGQLLTTLRQLAGGHTQPLRQLAQQLAAAQLSPFELLQAGLARRLLAFLTIGGGGERRGRLRAFLHALAAAPAAEAPSEAWQPTEQDTAPLAALVSSLQACLNQQEQLNVKMFDVSEGLGGRSPLQYFNENQLKCQLQRARDGGALRQWRHGSVRVDPLAPVEAIEKYLVSRGYGRLGGNCCSEESDSDDPEHALAAVSLGQGGHHQLQFLLNGHVLPYQMTALQAVLMYGADPAYRLDTVQCAAVFQATHVINYRPAPMSTSNGSSSRPPLKVPVGDSPRPGELLWSSGTAPEPQCPLQPYLTAQLPESVTFDDPSLETLQLLRLLHALSRHYGSLYRLPALWPPLLPEQAFINEQISSKAERQVRDPLILLTGTAPAWIQQLGLTCPFLFPFHTRRLLFFTTTLDRERALQRLQDSTGSRHRRLSGVTDVDRVPAARLERLRRVVSRHQPSRQAETLMAEMGSSSALLELQYQGEPGSGLGPTLEFYAQVSADLQRGELGLWRGQSFSRTSEEGSAAAGRSKQEPDQIHSALGLYPVPLGRNAHCTVASKIKIKFKFIGQFMARALLDGRLLDLPLSVPFYRWLLLQERHLSLSDVLQLDAQLASSLFQLAAAARRHHRLLMDGALSGEQRATAARKLTVRGCPVKELGLDFTLPGYPDIELKRGGRDQTVTLDNLDQYLKLLSHWLLVESVQKQMHAFRDGFQSILPLENLSMFFPEEFDQLFCGGQDELWEEAALAAALRPDHGYTAQSPPFRYLVTALVGLERQQRRQFLSFATGSPRLPVGGFAALSPPLTVVRKSVEGEANPDEFLPSVMTCVNYFKLPEYSSLAVTVSQLTKAIREGRLSFLLS